MAIRWMTSSAWPASWLADPVSLDLVLSILVLAAIALVFGAVMLWRRGGRTRQVWLMLLLALIVAGNLALWLVPYDNGTAPVSAAPR